MHVAMFNKCSLEIKKFIKINNKKMSSRTLSQNTHVDKMEKTVM